MNIPDKCRGITKAMLAGTWCLVHSSYIRFFGRYRPKEQVTGG